MSSNLSWLIIAQKLSDKLDDDMPRVKDQKEVFKGMLSELEQAIKEFIRIAKEKGMSKAEIDSFLENRCGATLDEVCKNKILH